MTLTLLRARTAHRTRCPEGDFCSRAARSKAKASGSGDRKSPGRGGFAPRFTEQQSHAQGWGLPKSRGFLYRGRQRASVTIRFAATTWATLSLTPTQTPSPAGFWEGASASSPVSPPHVPAPPLTSCCSHSALRPWRTTHPSLRGGDCRPQSWTWLLTCRLCRPGMQCPTLTWSCRRSLAGGEAASGGAEGSGGELDAPTQP